MGERGEPGEPELWIFGRDGLEAEIGEDGHAGDGAPEGGPTTESIHGSGLLGDELVVSQDGDHGDNRHRQELM
jgi:hypothetical protein